MPQIVYADNATGCIMKDYRVDLRPGLDSQLSRSSFVTCPSLGEDIESC
jgi:hypothetical protein